LPPPHWVRDIYAGGSGYMPTMTRRDARTLRGSQPQKRSPTSGQPLAWVMARENPDVAARGGRLNPTWCEWYMGWPMGWSDLEPLAMDRFREWLAKQ
jgi:hypothetical protein